MELSIKHGLSEAAGSLAITGARIGRLATIAKLAGDAEAETLVLRLEAELRFLSSSLVGIVHDVDRTEDMLAQDVPQDVA